jgi:hypothetical protein
MIVLRLFLYLICIISVGWSILVFGGPPIIKRLISGYSDGALIPSDITVSPKLDLRIGRLDFIFQNETPGWSIRGFSRATEITWSIFGEKPFLDISLGPSVVKNYATANSVNIYTPSLHKIDWQNIAITSKIDALTLNSFAKAGYLTLAGNLNLESRQISNVKIDAEKFSATSGSSTYSAHLITGDISELNFNPPRKKPQFSGTFAIKDIIASGPNLTAPESIIELSFEEEARNFKIDLHDIRLSEFDGYIERLKVDGSLSKFNVLQELQIVSVDGVFSKKMPKFPEISASVKKLVDEQYRAEIKGNLKEFELSNSGNFFGSLPSSNFLIDLKLDRATSKLSSKANINFNILGATHIVGIFEMGFRSEPLAKLECALSECELSDLDLAYSINFDDEWVRGSANCVKTYCGLMEMNHLVRTSNTVNIFTILNQVKILNPISTMYLYGVISSGQKINSGHELKFQF